MINKAILIFGLMLSQLYYLKAFAIPLNCGNEKRIMGTWHLVSVLEKIDNEPVRIDPMWVHPDGYLNYGSDNRMMVIIISGNRKVSANHKETDTQSAALFHSMTSYAGTYKISGNKIIHQIDVSWNQKWNNTNQTRYYQINGNKLTLTLPPIRKAGSTITRSLQWEKI